MFKPPQCNKIKYFDVLSEAIQCCLTHEIKELSVEEISSNGKDWNKNFASPDCGAKIGNHSVITLIFILKKKNKLLFNVILY